MMNRSRLHDPYDPPFPERRAVARTPLAHVDGHLACSGIDRVCRVRDLSPLGAGLESPELPRPGQRVWIEMRELARSAAVVIWRNPSRCGLRFEREQHLPAGIGQDIARRNRPPRYMLRGEARLESAGSGSALDVSDISLGGLRLSGAHGLAPGQREVILLEGWPEALPGRVIWSREHSAGFRFDRPIGGDRLFSYLCCHA